MFCTKCGAENRDGATFCSACGATFDDGAAAAQPAQAVVGADQTVAGVAQAAAGATQAAQAGGSGKGKTKVIAIVLCAVAVILCAAIVVLIFVFPGQKDTTPRAITVSFSADGYDSSCTKIPVAISGTEAGGASVETVGFIDESGSGISLAPGEYDLSFPASPLTPTGVLYNTPASIAHVNVSAKKDETGSIIAFQDESATFTKSSGADETDEMIDKAYEYAIMDESQKQKAEELKKIADNIHSQAVAAKNLAAARLIDMPLYTVQIPDYWVGKVDISKDGNKLSVKAKGYSDGDLINVSVGPASDQINAGDIGGGLVQYANTSNGYRVEMWMENWPWLAAASNSKKNSGMLDTCVKLITGGALSLSDVANISPGDTSTSYFRKASDYIDNNVILKVKDGGPTQK